MNRRQKKKHFKKIHGHNPPKGWDGKFSTDKDYTRIARIGDALTKGFRGGLSNINQEMKRLAELIRSMSITQAPCVIVARSLAERRKQCRKKEWKASRR